MAAAALHGMPDHYEVKPRAVGYRLVYRVDEAVVTITVVAVGKREGGKVYSAAKRR